MPLTSPKPLAEVDIEARAEHMRAVLGPRYVEGLPTYVDLGHMLQQLAQILFSSVYSGTLAAAGAPRPRPRPRQGSSR